ncbi:uncharacterized protein LOC132930295 isoform X2 [Rhopalosiphum padi]|uniref:uncharacterized protein LOC132930295 isoform X2 n=1 Tax=Rhopalosiphum padi TaxID=40932 RepID=UPI00298D7BC9|nr:uncharacterized protein LOC132930295 isoform X2 [Rhopalosiphum padi]
MNSLMVKIFIFIIHLYLLENAITEDVIELGQSACRYSGNYGDSDAGCYVDKFELSKLPANECTSYIYFGMTCKDDSTIVPNDSPDDLTNIKSLTNFSSKVFIFYGQTSIDFWSSENFNDKIETEAQNLKEFIDEYPVAGLILTKLEYPVVTDNFYEKFQSYVASLKSKNPKLKIGLYFKALTMVLYPANDINWFDFSKINDIMDFYLITFHDFNICYEEIMHIGTTPLELADPNVHSLVQFAATLTVSALAKEKVYLEFVLTPSVYSVHSGVKHCEVTYDQYCKRDYRDSWCADNATTFYEKGVFAKQYAAGWVGSDIDLIDRNISCGCNGDQFFSFHMILDGYKNKTMRTCDFKFG